jgi:hypothetical protein
MADGMPLAARICLFATAEKLYDVYFRYPHQLEMAKK